MFNAKELMTLILVTIMFTFILWFFQDASLIPYFLTVALFILLTNIIAKKIAAYYFDSEAEIKVWHLQRWGYYQRSYFKTPKPVGLIIPFILVLASAPTGFFKLLTFLQTDVKATIKRVAKRRGGLNRFAEMTEWHNGYIVSIGFFANLACVLLPYLFGEYDILRDIAKFSVIYVICNMIPLGQLDGTKILFINWKFWVFLWVLVVISLFFLIPL